MEFDVGMLQSTIANKLESSEVANTLTGMRISSTEAINVELLSKKIISKLNKLEHQLNIAEHEIRDIEVLINYLPEKMDSRLEADFRVSQIVEIIDLNKMTDELTAKLKATGVDEELSSLYYMIELRLKKVHNSPLKQQLLDALKDISQNYELTNSMAHVEKKTILHQIKTSSTIEELDNVLIELMFSDYINLDTIKRREVAKRFYDQHELSFENEDAVRFELKRLIFDYVYSSDNIVTDERIGNENETSIIISDTTEGIEVLDGKISIKGLL